MENLSGSETVSGSDTVSGTGGDTLFTFDPINAMSRKRRNKKLETMKCWPQVKHMLDNGIPLSEIVHYIQHTRKEYTNVKPNSLRVMINQWLGGLDNRKRLIDHRIPVRHINLINSNAERLDPIDAMNMLFAIQMDRVLMTYDKEKQKKTLNKDNGQALKLAMDMLNSLASMQNVGDPRIVMGKSMASPNASAEQRIDSTLAQMDRIKKAMEDRWGSTAAEVLMNPESRNKLFNAVNKIRKTAGTTMAQLIQDNTQKAEESSVMGTQIIEVLNDSDDIEAEFRDG